MMKIVTIIAGDDLGGPYSQALMIMDDEDVTDENMREMCSGVLSLYRESFGKDASGIICKVDDHVHEHVIPAYVARVAGTDHAESAHDTLAAAAHQALDSEMTVLVAVTPERHS